MPTVDADVPGSLPPELPGFVGRGQELGELKDLLGTSRLVTLTGVGGVGKTRLALRVAGKVRRAFPGGVRLVDLTQLQDPGLLAHEVQTPDVLAYLVLAAFGRQQGAGPPLPQLIEFLDGQQALLVLDNCEHLLPACAVLVEVLLRACVRLSVLATSREPLEAETEAVYRLDPLAVPPVEAGTDVDDALSFAALRLFVERATASASDFLLSPANLAAAIRICA